MSPTSCTAAGSALLVLAISILSVTAYGVYGLLSEMGRYSSMDVIRMFGGVP